MKNITDRVKLILLDDGTLPHYDFGGYPLLYLDTEGNVLCPGCANENDEFSAPVDACDANWENPHLYCDHCSDRIESAYAEDEHEED